VSGISREAATAPTLKGNGDPKIKAPAHPRGSRNGAGIHSQLRIRSV